MVNSLYIHYPYCKHLCHYCDFYKNVSTDSSSNNFIKSFKNSLVYHNNFLKDSGIQISKLETLYMGGGTPSLLGKNFKEFYSILSGEFDLTQLKEFTLEVDPGTCSEEDLILFKKLGVNRMSLGIQSYDPLVQPYLDRSHNIAGIDSLLKLVNNLDINFSVDFMLGLAHPSYLKRDIEKELEGILKYSPNHISLYILSVSSSYPFRNYLPSDEVVADEYIKVHEILTKKNFSHYEVSNYGLEGFESKHNWKYWNQESYLALGPSATGLIINEDKGIRYKWAPDNIKVTTEYLTKDQLKLEKFYTSLRTKKGIDPSEFNIDESILTSYCSAGYGEMVSKCFRFNEKGWVILDSLVDKLL